jgi:hypothetical protein
MTVNELIEKLSSLPEDKKELSIYVQNDDYLWTWDVNDVEVQEDKNGEFVALPYTESL